MARGAHGRAARRVPRGRQAHPQGRRPRQGHRARGLHRRPRRCRACCTRKLLRSPHAARAHLSHRRDARARAAGRARGDHRRRPAERYGIIPWTQDETRAGRGQGALRRRRGRGGRRRSTRTRRARRCGCIARRVRAAARGTSIRGRARAPRVAVHEHASEDNVSKHVRARVRRRRRRRSPARRRGRGRLLLRGHDPRADRAALRARATSTPTACSRCGRATQVPHYLHRELARVLGLPTQRDPRDPAGRRRRVRRQERAVRARVLRREARAWSPGRPVKILYTREEVFYAHRGRHPMQMHYRTGVTPRRQAHRRRRAHPHRRRRVLVLRPGHDVLLGPAAHRALRTRRRTASTRRACSPTSRRCGPKRGHGTVQPRFAFECQLDQARRGARHRSDRAAPHATSIGADTQHRQRHAHHLERLPRVPRRGRARARAGRSAARSCRYGRGLGVAGQHVHLAAPTTRSTRTRCRRARCSSRSIARARHGLHRRERHRPGLDTMLALIVVRGARPRARATCAWSRPTPISCPVDLGAYSSRVTFMIGNACLDAARKLRAPRRRRRGRALGLRSAASVIAGARRVACSIARPRARVMSVARGVPARRGRASARSARPATTTRPKLGGDYRGGTIGASPAYSFTAHVAEVRRRRRDRRGRGRQDLGRARLRPRAQPGHGRGPDGGLAPTWASPRRCSRSTVKPATRARRRAPPRTLAARLPHPDHPRHAGDRLAHRRAHRSRGAVRRQGGRRGSAAPEHPRRSPTPSSTRSASASTRLPFTPPRVLALLRTGDARAAWARRARQVRGRGEGSASCCRCPRFDVAQPADARRGARAARASRPTALVVAGGTDACPT